MSAVANRKVHRDAPQSSAELFSQLGDMFARPAATLSARTVSLALNEKVRRLREHMSIAELLTLRDVTRELASKIDSLIPEHESAPATPATAPELARARAEYAMGDRVLARAARALPAALSSPESIRQGDEAMVQAARNTVITTAARIAKGELISSGELQRALNVKRQALSGAVKAGRLFAIVGPSGDNYYPAYYADPSLDRRALEQVSKLLGSLPAASKHHFFTSHSTLLQASPLEALRQGRLAEVLAAAAGFAAR